MLCEYREYHIENVIQTEIINYCEFHLNEILKYCEFHLNEILNCPCSLRTSDGDFHVTAIMKYCECKLNEIINCPFP